MRISASGLLSTIAVAIDQILRLVPSIRPPIEPVVSSTNATSTVGFTEACDSPAESGRAASANARERSVVDDCMVLLQCFVPWNRSSPGFTVACATKQGGPGSDVWLARKRRYRFPERSGSNRTGGRLLDGPESVKVRAHGLPRSPDQPRARAGWPPVGNGAGGRARHRAAFAIAGLFLHQRIAAAVRPARRSGGAERARRDLDRRDQVIGGGSARRPEMAGLSRALRPAVLCLHPGSALRNFSRPHRADHRRRLWRTSAVRGAGAPPAGGDAQIDDGAVRDRRGAAHQPAGRSAGAWGV